MSKPAQKADQRPWRVTINATVTSEVEDITTPSWCNSMEDAVSSALDSFWMHHERDNYRIKSVTVEPAPQEDTE